MTVIKRDGREVEFDKNKIISAIHKAFIEVDKTLSDDALIISNNIADFIASRDRTMSVEEIQDIVEHKLMASKRKDVAKTYVRYRYLRGMARDQYKELMDAVAEKLTAKNILNPSISRGLKL